MKIFRVQGIPPTGNGGDIATPTGNSGVPPTIIKTNEEKFEDHLTYAKIFLLWFIVLIAVIGIPATWFYDKRLTIEIIVTIITGVVGWFLSQLKKKRK